jgi:hypothetical protein
VRTYADALAVREETIILSNSDLQVAADLRQAKPTWDESDICGIIIGSVWRTDPNAKSVIGDIAPDEASVVSIPTPVVRVVP